MAAVATWLTRVPIAAPIAASTCDEASCAASIVSGGIDAPASSWRMVAIPSWTRAATSGTYGASASVMRATVPSTISTATTVTSPAAAVRDQPRLRRPMTNGETVAAMITARSADAVTVNSSVAMKMTTPASATAASTRQAIAAALISQSGTTTRAGWLGSCRVTWLDPPQWRVAGMLAPSGSSRRPPALLFDPLEPLHEVAEPGFEVCSLGRLVSVRLRPALGLPRLDEGRRDERREDAQRGDGHQHDHPANRAADRIGRCGIAVADRGDGLEHIPEGQPRCRGNPADPATRSRCRRAASR